MNFNRSSLRFTLRTIPKQRFGSLLLVLCLLSMGCDRTPSPNPESSPPPPPEVRVLRVYPGKVPLTHEYVGRLAPVRVAEVRARVAGIVLKQVYKEGSDVNRGDVLFLIEPAPLEAELHATEAALAQAEANATNAAAVARRSRELAKKNLISAQDLDSVLANERSTAAAVKLAEANLETARLNLSYARVTAPIDGRAGRALVTVGALVGQNEPTQLTRIEQIDPIYVNFSLSIAEFQEMRDTTKSQDSRIVEVALSEDKPYPRKGTLDFSDLAVDPATGAVSLRAVVPNPERALLPGMFVKLKMETGVLENAFVLPQAALARDAEGAYVLVVDSQGKVVQRRVQIQSMTRSEWVVRGDLTAGEGVIIEGLQKVKPGDKAIAVATEISAVEAATR